MHITHLRSKNVQFSSRRVDFQIIGPSPCLAVRQLCLSTAGVYGWNDNVGIVSELEHLVAMRHWVKICSVCRRIDVGSLDDASRNTFEKNRSFKIAQLVA